MLAAAAVSLLPGWARSPLACRFAQCGEQEGGFPLVFRQRGRASRGAHPDGMEQFLHELTILSVLAELRKSDSTSILCRVA